MAACEQPQTLVMTTTECEGSAPIDISAGRPQKKRRRRAAGNGAQEDCFTCRRRAQKCDRRRPYCSQCIEIGKECAGYKTTLTWNVGVASRGKLRGLTCPVTLKNPDGSDAILTPEDIRRRKKARERAEEEEAANKSLASGSANFSIPFSGPTSAPSSAPTYMPTAQNEAWHSSELQSDLASRRTSDARPSALRHPSLQHIQTALGPQFDARGMPHSGSSTGSFADAEFHSPHEFSPSAFSESLPPVSAIYTSQPLGSHVDAYPDMLSSSVDSLPSATSYQESLAGFGSFPPSNLAQEEPLFSPGYDALMSGDPFGQLNYQHREDDVDGENKSLALFDSRFSGPFYHITPRLQSLMEYYDRHICPYLVAFDGPENPYRKHILQLATQNEGLQNAIAAFATNNLRMRKMAQPKEMGFITEITDAFDGTARSKDLTEPSPEETCYKQMSIDQLNLQLTDSRAAHDDSVLATLLILCLFHVCDSGFSKFKTQLAGVQKLLSLRKPGRQSDFTGWVEMFFIWFDVMTSAVNDREMQIKGESLDMLDYSANLGALEQFSGCDGRLFKLIARLSRLNLLAQGRPVRNQGRTMSAPRPSTAGRRPGTMPPMRKKTQPKSLALIDYDNVDGNGWGTPIISSDEETDLPNVDAGARTVPDDRREFWNEWNDIRARLVAWQMDTASPPPPSTTSPEFELGQRDLIHINESFRYSALLYTERLGHPLLPSSHPNFQAYVSQGLAHITALDITSCVNKFLLWPLFIIGTECVDETSRQIIRARCIEVQRESGFYNNLSGLAVLEKVWRDLGSDGQGREAAEIKARRRDSEAGTTGRYGQAFRWRRAMDRVEGEYILI